jgi:hypothetical protein
LSLHDASYGEGEILKVPITNVSDADFHLRNRSPYEFYGHTDQITLPRHSTEILRVKTGTRVATLELAFEVLNAFFCAEDKCSRKASSGG